MVGQHSRYDLGVVEVQDQPDAGLLAAAVGRPQLAGELCRAVVETGQENLALVFEFGQAGLVAPAFVLQCTVLAIGSLQGEIEFPQARLLGAVLAARRAQFLPEPFDLQQHVA
jgi:hypothetical protein